MSENGNTCGNCKYLLADPAKLDETMCMRYPPSAHPIIGVDPRLGKPVLSGVTAVFPPRQRVDPACGEHKPKLVS